MKRIEQARERDDGKSGQTEPDDSIFQARDDAGFGFAVFHTRETFEDQMPQNPHQQRADRLCEEARQEDDGQADERTR